MLDILYTNPLFRIIIATLSSAIIIYWVIEIIGLCLREKFTLKIKIKKTKTQELWPQLRHVQLNTLQLWLTWSKFRNFTPYLKNQIRGIIIAGLVFALFTAILGFLLAVIGLFLVVGFLAHHIKGRRKNFKRHLPDSLDALAQALRAGLSLPQAIALVEREMSGAVKEVFGALRRAQDYKITLKDALAFLEPQIKSTEWNMVSQALLMQERVGGNIVPILSQIAATIRERLTIEKEVQTATASGRLSGLIISALVPASFLMFASFNPQYVQILTNTTIGKLMLATAAILEIAGFLIIWRLVRIDI